MSALGRPIVDQDCVQVVRYVAVFAEGGSYQVFLLQDLPVDLRQLIRDRSFVRGEHICCACKLGYVEAINALKVTPDLLRRCSRGLRLPLLTFYLFDFFNWERLTSFGGNLPLHELHGLREAFKDRIRLACFELLAQGLDLILEETRPLPYAFDSANVALQKLVNVNCFLKLELFVILDQLQLLLVVVNTIYVEDEDVGWLLHPALIDANLRLAGLIVRDLMATRIFPVVH